MKSIKKMHFFLDKEKKEDSIGQKVGRSGK
jgi:hypothetical protein